VIKRFGGFQLFAKLLRVLFAPFIVRFLKPKTFIVNGAVYSLFYHSYNTTWANERAVEVPFVKSIVDSARDKRILEIGNVLSHFYPCDWDVIDKFERQKGVLNEDILTFRPHEKYDLIVSISTFEHIGYDDGSSDSASKIAESWRNVVNSCLSEDGLAVITSPIGYNSDMDDLVFRNAFAFDKIIFLKRGPGRSWEEVERAEAKLSEYGSPYSCANSVAIGLYEPRTRNTK
jgi:hypothetical protein